MQGTSPDQPPNESILPPAMSHQLNVGATMRDILPSKHSSASVPSLSHLPHSPSFASLALSEGDAIPVYASNLVPEPSVVDDLPAQSDIIIAVMGPTGAGKSTFINRAAGIEETEVGHGLESCTHTVKIVRCLDTQQNRRVVFVDTPGFNDTNVSDFDILELVANWLKLTYEQDIRLSGLLFFHRISDNRMGGSPMKYLRMFQNLCGREALKNVVLVTTMWDEVDEEEGHNRETELSNKYWSSMLELGGHTSRFFNTTESAWDIVSQFQDARCTVLLQKELVDLHLDLSETSAGRTLFSILVEIIKKIKEYLAQLEAKLKLNQYSANRTAVEQEKAEKEAMLRDANAKRKRYSVISRTVFRHFSSSHRSRSSAPVAARRPPVSSPATFSNFRIPDASSNTITSRGTAEDCGGSRLLQGTITALKIVHPMVGLAQIPGLQSLVGLVLNMAEIVNNMSVAERALIELAQKAGSLMVILGDKASNNSPTDRDSGAMLSVVEGLTKEMNKVLTVVRRISSQSTTKRFLLSAFDKATIEECNRQMTLACGIFGIQIALITQQAIVRIEERLNLALSMSLRQATTTRATTT